MFRRRAADEFVADVFIQAPIAITQTVTAWAMCESRAVVVKASFLFHFSRQRSRDEHERLVCAN
jgi:hypothetical protein